MLSFIVPAYNEEHELPRALASIRHAAAAAQRPFEIIVVDDASTDATPEIAKAAGARVVPVHVRQIAAVRTAGARAAGGDILFFVDADTWISPGHVVNALAALDAGCVGGGARVVAEGVPLWGRVFVRFSPSFISPSRGSAQARSSLPPVKISRRSVVSIPSFSPARKFIS